MNIVPDGIYLLLSLALLLLSGIFSAAEIGMLSVNRFRIHQLVEDGVPRARLLQRLLESRPKLLTAILIVITAFNYSNESLVTYWLHGQWGLPEWMPFIGLLLLVLVFAEVTPISYAAANPEAVSLRVAPFVAGALFVLRPAVAVVTVFANLLLRLFGYTPRERPLVTGEEVRTIVDIETERGVLEEEEKELIHSIFEFSDTIVREVMVPRIDMVAVSETASIAGAIDVNILHHFSRLPVYRDDLDHITGVLLAKDLLPFQIRGQTDLLAYKAMRPVTYVPETKLVSELLQELRETQQTMAIVLDEYGGTAGLVTVEDLLEEIVGEIYDEYDIQQPAAEWLDTRTLILDAKLSIYDAGDILNQELPEGEYDTVGGLLYSRFGDVPAVGEQVTIDDITFVVEALSGHRITRVRVVLPGKESEQ